MPRHFLDLAGAATVKTLPYNFTKRLVPDLVEAAAIGAVYGQAGNGKTFAVEAAIENVAIPKVCLTSLNRPTMKGVALSVLEKITKVRHHGELMRLTDDLFAVLSEERRLIVFDEAQNLSTECFEYLRHLHDDASTNFALLFVGGNRCWEVISRHPMLRSRVWHKVEFKPLEPHEVVNVIPRFHGIYRDCQAELLLEIDEEFAHGNFRNWAAFTMTVVLLCQERKVTLVDAKIVQAALVLHRGSADAKAA
jgi:DNA transposition AAA+ family ATPase